MSIDGKAQSDAVISKFVGLKPELRSQIKSLISEIKAIVQQINALSLADQESLLEELAPRKVDARKACSRATTTTTTASA